MNRLFVTTLAGAFAIAGLTTLGVATATGQIQVAQADPDPALLAALMDEGAEGFEDNCAICHGDEGQGGGTGPRLAGNSFVGSNTAIVTQIIEGYEDHGMPPFGHLDDRLIAAIATFVRNSWGNDFGPVQPAVVGQIRADLAAAGSGE
jgi:mono/diheme cytochrome c family protein